MSYRVRDATDPLHDLLWDTDAAGGRRPQPAEPLGDGHKNECDNPIETGPCPSGAAPSGPVRQSVVEGVTPHTTGEGVATIHRYICPLFPTLQPRARLLGEHGPTWGVLREHGLVGKHALLGQEGHAQSAASGGDAAAVEASRWSLASNSVWCAGRARTVGRVGWRRRRGGKPLELGLKLGVVPGRARTVGRVGGRRRRGGEPLELGLKLGVVPEEHAQSVASHRSCTHSAPVPAHEGPASVSERPRGHREQHRRRADGAGRAQRRRTCAAHGPAAVRRRRTCAAHGPTAVR